MGTQSLVILTIFYYVFMSIGIGVLGQSGLLDETASITTNPDVSAFSANETKSIDEEPVKTGFFTSLWNFAANWNVDLGVGAWVWLIRVLFVYLPVTITLILFVYSLPFMGGH